MNKQKNPPGFSILFLSLILALVVVECHEVYSFVQTAPLKNIHWNESLVHFKTPWHHHHYTLAETCCKEVPKKPCGNMGHRCIADSRCSRSMDMILGSNPGLDIILVPGDKQVTNISLFFISLARSVLPLTTAQKSSHLSFFPICLPYTSSH